MARLAIVVAVALLAFALAPPPAAAIDGLGDCIGSSNSGHVSVSVGNCVCIAGVNTQIQRCTVS